MQFSDRQHAQATPLRLNTPHYQSSNEEINQQHKANQKWINALDKKMNKLEKQKRRQRKIKNQNRRKKIITCQKLENKWLNLQTMLNEHKRSGITTSKEKQIKRKITQQHRIFSQAC